MKKKTLVAALVLCLMIFVNMLCVSKSTGTAQPETKAAGKWAGYIMSIMLPPLITFDGANLFLTISSGDSSFHMVARDTMKIRSTTIKDTILLLNGSWRLTAAQDSIALQCNYCRVVDTTANTLYERPVDQRIPLFLNITQQDASTIWAIPFSDLAPLVPLLGLSIPAAQQSMLKNLTVALEKIPQ